MLFNRMSHCKLTRTFTECKNRVEKNICISVNLSKATLICLAERMRMNQVTQTLVRREFNS